jgi:superfamily II DNA helicase RecQ
MQVKIFTIPIIGGETANDELNVFLRTKKVLKTEKQLVVSDNQAFWSFCVSYLDEMIANKNSKAKIDYMKVLDRESFERFSKMREIRKRIANEEAIPAYAVFTDEELSKLAKFSALQLSDITSIKGIGEKKAEKYGKHFILKDEKRQLPDKENSGTQ